MWKISTLLKLSIVVAMVFAMTACSQAPQAPNLDSVASLIAKHRYDQAKIKLAEYEAATGGDARSHRMMADVFLALGDGFAADVYIRKIAANAITDSDRKTLIAHSLIVRDRPFDAISLLTEQLPRAKWTGETFRIAIWACRAYERFDAADQLLEEGLRVFPENSQLLALRARQLLDVGDLEAAATTAAQSLAADKSNFEALLISGEIALRRGASNEALRHYRQASALYPNNPLPKVNVAGILIDQNQLAEARAALNKSLKEHPSHHLLIFQQARLDLLNRNYQEAQRRLNSAWSSLESYVPAQILSARVSIGLGNRDTAEAMLERAAKDERFLEEINLIRKEHGLAATLAEKP